MSLFSSLAVMLSLTPIPDGGEEPMDKFDRAFAYVYDNEGGFVNDPHDSGGPTKYGVTIKTLSAWRGKPQGLIDVKNLSIDEARMIAQKLYWDKAGCASIEAESLATVLFDASILFGVRAASLALQRALRALGHSVNLDGRIGPKTLAAANSESPERLLTALSGMLTDRVEVICQLSPSKLRFKKGWDNRIQRYALLTRPQNLV